MGKKIVRLTESQFVKALKSVIEEQKNFYETDMEFIKAVQKFLNKKYRLNLEIDGKTGRNSKTSDAISRYQREIDKYNPYDPLEYDGIFGPKTLERMPEEDRKVFYDIYEQPDLLDKIIRAFT